MNRLLLLILLSLIGFSSQIEAQSLNLEGAWTFKYAEYMEMPPSLQNYQVKYVINDKENLYAHSACFQEIVMDINFYGSEVAIMETLFTSFVGKYYLIQASSSQNKQIIMHFGDIEDVGKDSPLPDMKYNAPGIQYLVEFIDEQTISITLEKPCYEDGVYTECAVRCFFKRDK